MVMNVVLSVVVEHVVVEKAVVSAAGTHLVKDIAVIVWMRASLLSSSDSSMRHSEF